MFELGPIRPPSEAQSLLIRLTRGCHWNKCNFCGLYKKMKFSARSVEAVQEDIVRAAEYHNGYPFLSCFLQDGDAFVLPTDKLLKILGTLKENFPTLKYVTSYARANTIIRKSAEELKELRDAGLNHLYCGIETGSDTILKKVNKGITYDDIVKSGLALKEAGIIISEFIMLGLGGRELWKESAEKTAEVLNIINPEFIRVHATGIKHDTELGMAMKRGEFQLQSEEEIVIEQRLLIERLENAGSYYMNEHGINLLMDVNGRLPDDKQKMLNIIDEYLELPEEDKFNFELGRRMGYYLYLRDMKDERRKSIVNQNIKKIREQLPESDYSEICNYFREHMI